MDIGYGTDQLFIVSRTGSGHVLRFDMSFGILSKRPELENWIPIQNLKEFACVAYKQYVFVIGGYSVRLKRSIQNMKRYDTITKEWSDMSGMELERRLCTAIVFSDEIIVCGGFKNANKLHATSEIFNLSRNKWRKGPNLKKGMCDVQLIQIGNSVFGFGGMKSSFYQNEIVFCSSDDILEYLNDCKDWMVTDDTVPLVMGKPLYGHSVVEIESKIYIIGGMKTIVDSNNKISEVINTKMESLFMNNNQLQCLNKNNLKDWISPWDRSLPSPNISRFGAAAVALGGDIYLFGGITDDKINGVLEVERFITKRCRWNTEFFIKHEVDFTSVSALKVFGSQYRRPIPIISDDNQTEEIIVKIDELILSDKKSHLMEENLKKMYKVGWILW